MPDQFSFWQISLLPGVCSFCWNFTEGQILWSLCSVDFHTLTLQLPIQTPHSVVPELQVFVSSLKISAKRAHPGISFLRHLFPLKGYLPSVEVLYKPREVSTALPVNVDGKCRGNLSRPARQVPRQTSPSPARPPTPSGDPLKVFRGILLYHRLQGPVENGAMSRGVLVLLKFYWGPDIVKFVLGRFSHFNIAIAYSNSTFCGAWTPSFCEFTQNFSKTSTPQVCSHWRIFSKWIPGWILSNVEAFIRNFDQIKEITTELGNFHK